MPNEATHDWSDFVWFVAASTSLVMGCAREKPSPVVPRRAVAVMELTETNPASTLRLPGSVTPWKEEEIAFQVSGRVDWVIEADRDVKGPSSNASYEPLNDGDLIARLDTKRYDAALASSKANLAAAQAQVEATRVQATRIIVRELQRARIEMKRSKLQHDRIARAAATRSVAESEVDDARAAYNTAVTNLELLTAKKTTHDVELELHQAQRQQAVEAVKQAKLDHDDTSLRAPFDARISQVHVTRGTIVQAGTPVATLVVMDPVKVEVVVSAARDRQLATNDEVLVHSDATPNEPIPAIVYQKSAVASSNTRTFKVTLLCRNRRIETVQDAIGDAVPIAGFMRPQQFDVDGGPRWFVEQSCIQSSGGRHFAWRVISPDDGPEEKALDTQRFELTLGAARKNIFGIFRFREFIANDAMSDELRWQTVLARGVPERYTDGQRVIKTSERWQLRPGGIVNVQLVGRAPPRGIYVRKKHIRVEGDNRFVFLVAGDGNKLKAKKTQIDITNDRIGDLHRITAGEGIQVGGRMITSGTHYLQDGTDIEILEVSP